MPPSTVLVTGASRFLGGQLAARLAADPTVGRVLAVDSVPPRPELSRKMGRAEFVQLDLRDPSINKVISGTKADTVVHALVSACPCDSGGRSTMKEMNVLRFTDIIGPRIDTVLSRYFSLRVVPTVLGYDGRVQLLHEEDALAVLERATKVALPGVVNVGGDGVLLLSQAIRRVGAISVPVPEPAVGTVGWLLGRTQLLDYSEQARFFNFGRVLDTTRLRTEFGFTPRWTTVQAFDD